MAEIKNDQRVSYLNSLNLENERLLQSTEISEDTKAKARAVRTSGFNVINAEGFKHASDKYAYQLGIATAVNNILKNKEAFSKVEEEEPVQNSLGRYSEAGINYMVNETVRRVLNSAKPVQDTSNWKQYVSIDPSEGFNSYTLSNTTVQDRIKNFATHLQNKLLGYITGPYADKNKFIISGISDTGFNNLQQYINQANLIANGDGNLNDILKLGEIVSAIDNDNLTSTFEDYFSQWLDYEDQPSVAGGTGAIGNKLGELEEGVYKDAATTQYLKSKGYRVVKDGDKLRLVDAQGNSVSDFAELDPTSPFYQMGFFTGDNGEILTSGNLTDPEFLKTINDKWTSLSSLIRNQYKEKFPIVDYTSQGGSKGIDFSNYFEDPELRFVNTGDWDYENNLWLPFGEWFGLEWNNIKSGFKFSGNADVSLTGENTNNQYAKSKGFIDPSELNFEGIEDFTDDEIEKYFAGNGNRTGDINGSAGSFSKDLTVTQLLANSSSDSLGDKITQFITYYISADNGDEHSKELIDKVFPNETQVYDGTELGKRFMLQLIERQPTLYLRLLKKALHNQNLTTEQRKNLIKEYQKRRTLSVASEKEGGIVKMFLGGATTENKSSITVASGDDNSKDKNERPIVNAGRSTEQQEEGIEGDIFTPIDLIRLGSFAADLGAIAASNVPGYGTALAGILGVGSAGIDFAADAFDKSVSKKDMLANLGQNIGFAAVGMIPDAKAITTASKAVKFLARLSKRAGGAARILGAANLTGESYNRAMQLFNNPESREFTHDDIVLITNILRSLAGRRMSKKMQAKNQQIQKTLSTDKRNIPVTVDGKTKNIPLAKEEFDEVHNAARTNGDKAALEKMKSFTSENIDNGVLPFSYGDSGSKIARLRHWAGRNTPFHSASTSYETYGVALKPEAAGKPLPSEISWALGTWDPNMSWSKNIKLRPYWMRNESVPTVKINSDGSIQMVRSTKPKKVKTTSEVKSEPIKSEPVKATEVKSEPVTTEVKSESVKTELSVPTSTKSKTPKVKLNSKKKKNKKRKHLDGGVLDRMKDYINK